MSDGRKNPWRVIGESVDALPPQVRSKLLRAFASAAVNAFFGSDRGPDFFDALTEVGYLPERVERTRPIHKADGRIIYPEGFEDLPAREPDPADLRAQQSFAREQTWREIAAIPDYYEREAAAKKQRRLHGPPMPGSLTP